MNAQLSMWDILDPPPQPPESHAGEICACGWLMAAMHINVVDRDGRGRVRHLWLWVPDDEPDITAPAAARKEEAYGTLNSTPNDLCDAFAAYDSGRAAWQEWGR